MSVAIRLLIAEDSVDDSEFLVLVLSRAGFDAVWKRVETPAEMSTALGESPWDMVVSDHSMPGFGAVEALSLCRKIDPDIPFVVVSGTIGEESAVEMMRAGANDYILKSDLTRLSPVIEREIRETVNRRAHRRAEEAAARLAAIIESSEDAIISETLEGIVNSWNPAAERLFGWTSEETIGREISFLAPKDKAYEIALEMDRLRLGEHFELLETVRLHKDGTRRDVSISVSPIHDRDGRLCGFSKVVRDIALRKQSEQDIRQSEQRLQQQTRILQSVLDNMSDGVAVADEHGKFLVFNPAAEEILQFGGVDAPPEEWAERFSLYLPDGKSLFPAADEPLAKALRGERSDDVEMIVNHHHVPEGRWISVNARPMRDAEGTLRGGVAVFRNITERKRAEAAIRSSEERYRTLVAATTAIVWGTPASGEFEAEQPGWTAFTGQTFEELRGSGWLNAVHPDDRANTAAVWLAAWKTRSIYEVEHRLHRADGEYRQMAGRAVPICEADGTVREWVGVHTDITNHRRAELERAELLAQLTVQIERMPLAYLLCGPDFGYVRWNPAAERMFEFSETEILGKLPSETIVPPQSEAMVADLFSRLAAGDMNAHGTCENVTQSGRTIVCEWQNTPLFDKDGVFQGVLSLAQDVTSRERSDQALLAAQQRLQHVLASSPAVLYTLTIIDNAIGSISWVSENIRKIFGYSPEVALAPGWWESNIHELDRAATIARTQEALFEVGTSTNEYRFRHQNGQFFWARSELRLIRNATGRPLEAVGSWSNVTDRKLLEEQFRQAQKMEAFGQLAGGVAHDFNNLLTIINGYSALLLQKLPRSDSSRELVTEILRAGERSAGLTRQLLAFSRQQVLAPRILNLNVVVTETEKMLRRLIGEDIQLTTTLDSKLWAVQADLGQIEQVLLNLAVNARDAMPMGGSLTIETHNVELDHVDASLQADAHPGPHVLINVTDNGIGMSREVQARIFEPFFTTKGLGKGTGLGLATVYGIIKQSGGHVAVHSELGVGTTFKAYLPKVEQKSKGSKAPSQILAIKRGTETILLAEDEAALLELCARVLVACGYKVLTAADGDEALRVAAAHEGPIHMLITDVVMPGTAGRTVASILTERRPGLRVLYMSGYTDDAVIRHEVLREGMNFLQKPFTPVALTYKVREVLEEHATEKQE
jgi:PAS domain S-box-containing protein